MKVTVRITKNFKKEAKTLLKKFQSLSKDLLLLEKELTETPRIGVPLGHDCYKVRLKITSKRKGKSGGARVITKVETEIFGIAQVEIDKEITVSLLSIYDKSDIGSITDYELKELIKHYKD